jgi:hypothetical protein
MERGTIVNGLRLKEPRVGRLAVALLTGVTLAGTISCAKSGRSRGPVADGATPVAQDTGAKPVPPQESRSVALQGARVPPGGWGGQGLALTVTESGAHLEFDCGSGDIPRPIVTDGEGRIALDGVFTPGQPGPTRGNGAADRMPARYVGRVEGERMTLGVTLIDTGQSMGSFNVAKGADAILRRCL